MDTNLSCAAYFNLSCASAEGPINGGLSINVEEFRRPEYECKATVRPLTGHISASDPLKVSQTSDSATRIN